MLATIPSHWIDPECGVFATAYHRTAVFECHAQLVEEASHIAALQNELMQRYQPEGSYRPVAASDPMYSKLLEMLVGVGLLVHRQAAPEPEGH